jgi:hypothetical protein
MTVFKVLSEMVRPEELFNIVAFAKLVHASQMLKPLLPVWLWIVGKFLATITACVVRGAHVRLCSR